MRALFEVTLRNGWPVMASRLLTLCKTVDKRLWGFENPLRQFPTITEETFRKLRRCHLTLDRIKEMSARDIGRWNESLILSSRTMYPPAVVLPF